MGKLFRNFGTVKRIIVQIIIVVLLLPFAAILFGVVFNSGGSANNAGFLYSLIGKIPLCDIWVDMLYQYSGGLDVSDVASSAFMVVLKAFPETLISVICCYACERILNRGNSRGLPILAAFGGVTIATLITNLTGSSGNMLAEILMDFGVVIILIIGIKIMFNSVFNGARIMNIKKILVFIIDGLFAVITTGYISGLLMAVNGLFSSVGEIIGKISALTAIEIIAAGIVWLIGNAAEKDGTII